MKCSSRDMALFVAGFAASHALTHLWLKHLVTFPVMLPFLHMELTEQMNMIGIIASAIIAVVLLWWACRR